MRKEKEEKIIFTQMFKVKRSEELLSFLLNKMNTSRNNIKHLLTNHQILVNGNVISQYNYMLGVDDEVKISKNRINDVAKNKNEPKKRLPKIEIIYEDDNFIAIDKPAGLLSVESDKDRNSAYMLVSKYLEEKSKSRCYIIHRIDMETSGVLVFTKNPKIHSILRLNWNDYVITREYIAICEGKLENKTGTLINYLGLNKNNLVYVTNPSNGKKAITDYEVLNYNNGYSLLKVLISTGRKNQIRVQLNNIGHPIVFDEKYGYTKNPINRLGLHASILEIKNPLDGNIITFKAPVPGIFKSLF